MHEDADAALRVLRDVFKYEGFRGPQKAAIRATLNGDDVMVVMATGGGKSLCYQVPALVRGKTAVVVSPLISLMDDQVRQLCERGASACLLGSAQQDDEIRAAAWAGRYSLVYVTPEMAIACADRLAELNRVVGGLSLLAIDEAHCISEWGHDYRPEYNRLGELRGMLPGVPIVAVTATATLRVMREIKDRLCLGGGMRVFRTSFNRSNLRLEVVRRPSPVARELSRACREATVTGGGVIIYSLTTKKTDELWAELRDLLARHRLQVHRYHAKMAVDERRSSHEAFIAAEAAVMVATVAYGMGINKPDVRAVLHVGMPASLETYYQQAGRAGRDGRPSVCRLYWAPSDLTMLDIVRFRDGLKGYDAAHVDNICDATTAMRAYCHTKACRAQTISAHFGEEWKRDMCEGTCDNCDKRFVARERRQEEEEEQLTDAGMMALRAVRALNGRLGLGRAVDLLRGKFDKGSRNLAEHELAGKGRSRSEEYWQDEMGALIVRGLVRFRICSSPGRAFSAPTLTEAGRGMCLGGSAP